MIKIEQVSKSFGQKVVLNNINIDIADGEICGIMGVNGAGKSTLMKIICHLTYPDNGTVTINNIQQNDNSNIGALIESPAFYNNLSAFDNLYAFSLLYDNVTKQDILYYLQKVGLPNSKTKFQHFSQGMKQRLYLAFAFMNKPKVLILDEPFTGIDPISRLLFRNIIQEFALEGNSVFISGHNITEMQELCDSIYLLDNSKIVFGSKNIKDLDLDSIIMNNLNNTGCSQ